MYSIIILSFSYFIDIDKTTAEKVWHPVIEFENLLKLEQKKLYGGNNQFSFWMYYNKFKYLEMLQLTFSCPFHFSNFPFDSHECHLEYGSYLYPTSKVVLSSSIILYGNDTTSVGSDPIIINESPLPFDFELESLPTSEKFYFQH